MNKDFERKEYTSKLSRGHFKEEGKGAALSELPTLFQLLC